MLRIESQRRHGPMTSTSEGLLGERSRLREYRNAGGGDTAHAVTDTSPMCEEVS
jgi:hypothetical protein